MVWLDKVDFYAGYTDYHRRDAYLYSKNKILYGLLSVGCETTFSRGEMKCNFPATFCPVLLTATAMVTTKFSFRCRFFRSYMQSREFVRYTQKGARIPVGLNHSLYLTVKVDIITTRINHT